MILFKSHTQSIIFKLLSQVFYLCLMELRSIDLNVDDDNFDKNIIQKIISIEQSQLLLLLGINWFGVLWMVNKWLFAHVEQVEVNDWI